MTRLLAAVAFALCVPPLTAAEKPNVVLIVLDDAGQRDFGCYGSTYHKSPHLDALAKQGVRFTEATSASPVCSPTRVAILTGRHPVRYGLTDWVPGQPPRPGQRLVGPKNATALPLAAVTVGEHFRAAGYRTAHVGKWHLGGPGFAPTEQGFDLNVGGSAAGHPPSYFAPYGPSITGLGAAPTGEYLTDRLTDEAVRFVAAEPGKPFFLCLAHYAPHTPLQARPEVVARYAPGKLGAQGNPTYAAMIESLDDSLARLLRALDDAKVAGNTVVILTSDNGGLATLEGMAKPATFNGPYREGKGYLYEGGLRVPLVIRAPGVKPAVLAGAVDSIDLLPTLLDLCGLPAEPKDFDGVSLAKVLHGSELPARSLVHFYPHYANQGGKPGVAIRRGDWKLLVDFETDRGELYDLKADPSEGRNVAAENAKVVAELRGEIDAWVKSRGAKLPTPNPKYRPNPPDANGVITMHARTATVTGTQLRYEPLPHKETLGYWVRAADTAAFDFTAATPGEYAVEVLQGCGKGSGGSEVELSVGASKLTFTVKDTGGFQAFERRAVGTLTVAAGRQTLNVKPLTKPGAAVMDLREVVLRPAK